MTLDFDESTHTYRIDGVRVPSVTQVIQAILPPRYEFAGEWHMQRGAATHHGCRLLDEGRLDWASVDPEIEPRIRAWQQFRQQYGGEIVANEQPLASLKHRYAGTLDRMIEKGQSLIVADLKNSVAAQVYLQLAAYSLLWKEETGWTPSDAVAVELLEGGEYRCRWMNKHELRRAEQQWLALLTVFNFAQEHKLLKG